MSIYPSKCPCTRCRPSESPGVPAPEASIAAIRARGSRSVDGQDFCPRCYTELGPMEVVVDAVAHAHFVQACSWCPALWVSL